jgi:hypothetical protein
MLVFAACGQPAAPTTTLPSAATLLQQATKADYHDVTFTIAFTITTQGQTVTGTGSGEATKTPERMQAQLQFPITLRGKSMQFAFDTITDMTTNATYTKITGVPGVSTRWTKSSLTSGGASPIDVNSLTDYGTLQNAKTIGAETIDGVAVWNVQGTAPAATPTPAKATATPTKTPKATATAAATASPTAAAEPTTVDVYLRQDNSYPVKATVQMAGSTPGTVTLTFTKFNSGVSITLPKL